MRTLIDLAGAPVRELDRLIAEMPGPDPEILAGWEFKGHNVPWWAKYVGISKFKKGFFRRPSGTYAGYNIPVRTSPITEPWECKPSDANPKRFGFYEVLPAKEARTKIDRERYSGALLLDYGAAPDNPVLDPSRFLRDFVVRVESGNDDLFLGKAYLALGPVRVYVDYFILERDRKSDFAHVAGRNA